LLALSFAAGLDRLLRAVRPHGVGCWVRRGLWAVVGCGFTLNAGWGIHAASTIRRTTPASILADWRRDVGRARAPFRVSPPLRAALGEPLPAGLRCAPASPD